MAREQFDLLIIGGGITGAGLALDAASRGLKVALVEKRDFASGTSSRSTKLIHGGLRYLEHFDFKLVREALRERAILLKLAPHLVESLSFLIPIYSDKRKNYDRPLKIRAGLWLYDLLAGTRNLGKHKRISREETLRFAPQLDESGLTGGFVYYDGVTNDSRLVIEIMKTANEHGAAIANYTRVGGFHTNESGTLTGAHLRDEITGGEFDIKAHISINATGVWLDNVANLATRADQNKRIRPSKGIHLVVGSERLKVSCALLIPSLREHRFYFVVPWQGAVVIGTTDTDYSGNIEAPRANNDEVKEILDAINAFFPSLKLLPSDIISAFAGLRPLINSHNQKASKDVSRSEEIYEDQNGLISIAGGKLTTYRSIAKRTIDLAARKLTEKFGYATIPESGTSEIMIGETNHKQPSLDEEVIQAVRFEMALTVADVLCRRRRSALIDGKQSLDQAESVAQIMGSELGWNEEAKKQKLEAYRREFDLEYAVRL